MIELREIVEFKRVGLMPNRCSASSPEPPAREWRFQTRFGSTCNLWGSAQSLPQCSWQKGRVAPQARPKAVLKNTMNSSNKNPTKERAQFGGLKFDFLGCSHEIVGKIQNDLVPNSLVYLRWGATLPHSLWRNFQLKQSPLHCWKQPCGVQGLAIRFL